MSATLFARGSRESLVRPWIPGCEGSPDGRYIAYRFADCPSSWFGGVVIGDPEGNIVAPFPGAGWAISWSPDSTRVAVWDSHRMETIGVYGLDGARQTQLTMPPWWSRSEITTRCGSRTVPR